MSQDSKQRTVRLVLEIVKAIVYAVAGYFGIGAVS